MSLNKKKKQVSEETLIFESKLPWEYYAFFTGLIGITLLFSNFIIVGRLDFKAGLFCIILFNSSLYGLLGRFLSRIKIYSNKIEIKYILPWDKSKTYCFKKISDIDKRPDSVFNPIGLITPIKGDGSYYRGFKKIYFLIDDKEMVLLKYNISEDSEVEMINKLNQMANHTLQ